MCNIDDSVSDSESVTFSQGLRLSRPRGGAAVQGRDEAKNTLHIAAHNRSIRGYMHASESGGAFGQQRLLVCCNRKGTYVLDCAQVRNRIVTIPMCPRYIRVWCECIRRTEDLPKPGRQTFSTSTEPGEPQMQVPMNGHA